MNTISDLNVNIHQAWRVFISYVEEHEYVNHSWVGPPVIARDGLCASNCELWDAVPLEERLTKKVFEPLGNQMNHFCT